MQAISTEYGPQSLFQRTNLIRVVALQV